MEIRIIGKPNELKNLSLTIKGSQKQIIMGANGRPINGSDYSGGHSNHKQLS